MTVIPALDMRAISKSFPGVRALDGVDFDCHAGEVHALCGENGAGKSTLMKILGAVYRPDSGQLRIGGEIADFKHPREARAAGISIVHQELSLMPFRTVAENVFAGQEPTRHGILDRKRMEQRTEELLRRLGSTISSSTQVSTLSIAEQQLVEIAKALLLDATVLVMDEPTAALDDRDARVLLRLVEKLRAEGVAIVYISHRMPEVMAIADRVTVLKDGRKIWTKARREVEVDAIVTAMVGRDITEFFPAAGHSGPGDVLLEILRGSNAMLRDIDLRVRAGEIVGVAGLEDSGKAALAQAIFGDDPLTEGSISVEGRVVSVKSPRQAIAAGIGYLPGDRKREGLVLRQSVRDNALLTLQGMAHVFSRPHRRGLTQAETDLALKTMDVRAGDYGQEIGTLSGGNQQKTIISRWLAQAPKVLIFTEPTRGIDVAAKASIYETMRRLADSGRAIVMISSDLPEVVGVSDRIVVMHQGRISGELDRGASEEAVMALALGITEPNWREETIA
ncbi:ATP-binding cassette domain-containing protein [Rhizobium leguminosarum bv. viciae]|uniref:sugar ABC transporter ATP-binding protein n=1 Tax=Rhizobium leguminosarum TaxID=384 RepID=UPI001441C512|nr:sugar ABC transporter ATP-binding protein [Rhizobium leguminosarum]NKK87459.1 ATP-binding cassette domain-containing protein [Rhizobium leguminosarum bv. viciae]